MHIETLLKMKLKQDSLNELLLMYDKNTIFMNKKLYHKLCLQKINSKIKSINFMNQKSKLCYVADNNRCCARIWDDHYGTRCNYWRYKNEDYCKHHLNMIKKKGKLLFNRYDEERPIYNEKNNYIPWMTIPPIEVTNQVLQRQWNNLSSIIHTNLKKQRQITPKI
jgi:hypothetical protein